MKRLKVNIAAVLLTVAAAALSACGALNPLARAQTIEQKAYALYGEFTIIEEQAAALVQEPSVPTSAKRAIAETDAVVKPVAGKMLAAVLTVEQIRDDIAAGKSTEEKLVIATANLHKWYNEVLPLVEDLAAAVKGARL